MSAWIKLGEVAPAALADARLQLHHMAQVAAAVGFAYVPPATDFSHSNLEWTGDMLVRRATVGGRSVAAGLRAAPAALILDTEGEGRRELPLAGRTLDQAFTWMAESLAQTTGAERIELPRPTHDLPQHRITAGQAFSADGGALAELGRWLADADMILREVAAQLDDPTPVRCWPHHFDIATLEALGGSGEDLRSVGVGMTPGDGGYAEPYWYVTPWPFPADPPTTPLPSGGHWHTQGWTGAVLTADRTIEGDADAQAARVRGFLGAAITACRELARAE